ncbi:hypothetical protein [Halomonas caseinilytica]|uniref:hypothetical protein n=1 Tax=Halomonas caseinilytica TaxID=438744 RepID=UPI0010BF42CD|nr:hypothetical protein [Halomonas caseinilytica]
MKANDVFSQLLKEGWSEVREGSNYYPIASSPIDIEVALLREIRSNRLRGTLIVDKYQDTLPASHSTDTITGPARYIRTGPKDNIKRVAWRAI